MTNRRADAAFFTKHRLSELETWRDHDLEEQGRLTEPMRWDPESDTYKPVLWETAFEEIGRELCALEAKKVDFYTRVGPRSKPPTCINCSRIYGSNHLPDCSNMCESSSVGLSRKASARPSVLRPFGF